MEIQHVIDVEISNLQQHNNVTAGTLLFELSK